MVGKWSERPLPRRQLCRDENGFKDRDQQRRDLLEIQERPPRQLRSHIGQADGSQTVLQFGTGYWTFGMISERLKSDDVSLTKNRHNNTCRIHSNKYEIHLGNFGLLLGFKKDTVITRGTKTDSGEVDVNFGFRLVTIGCDIVNPTKNFNPGGKRSKTIATFPITTEQPLFNYVSFYKNVNFEAPVINGFFRRHKHRGGSRDEHLGRILL